MKERGYSFAGAKKNRAADIFGDPMWKILTGV
jgi:hypothetical protein